MAAPTGSIERIEELQDMLAEAASEGHANDWCAEVADFLGELIARRRVAQAHWKGAP